MEAEPKVRPPSYEETMERLGRSPEHNVGTSNDREHDYDVQVFKTHDHHYDDHPSPLTIASGDRQLRNGQGNPSEGANTRNDEGSQNGADRERQNGNEPTEFADEPATISHTAVRPEIVHTATVHLPTDPMSSPTDPTSSSSSTSKSKKKSYLKKNQSKKSRTSAGGGGFDEAGLMIDIRGKRSTSSQSQDYDYWSTSGSPTTSIQPVIMKPMKTCVGSDGKTYIRDTSIEVVEHDVHRKRNLEIVNKRPTLPDNYQWYSILGTICCFVIGAYSLKRSREVQPLFDARDYRGAEMASKSALKWATVAFTLGAIIIVFFIFLLFVEPCPIARALQNDRICPRGT